MDPYKGSEFGGILHLPCTSLRKLLEDVLHQNKGEIEKEKDLELMKQGSNTGKM